MTTALVEKQSPRGHAGLVIDKFFSWHAAVFGACGGDGQERIPVRVSVI